MTAGQHNASASAVGYLYQVNWALIELLESAPTKPDQAISLVGLPRFDGQGW
jgi:hypothetical protein